MARKSFLIPSPITPRPGEKIVAYQGLSKHEGIFVGYNISDGLILKSGDSFIVVKEFLQTRPQNPLKRPEPCWAQYKESGNIKTASKTQKDKLDRLINQSITPGPSYYDLIFEIWNRGYETFLVGGSVRDVINGATPKDVDIVTTIPFNILIPIVKSMFGNSGYSRQNLNGFISIGLDASKYKSRSKYDPLIDMKNFFIYGPGTADAQFGSNIESDLKFRDFACNAIYYEPINSFFIDPSGLGISDAKTKKLNLVNNSSSEHPTYKRADISFRYFKFILRGYTPTEECIRLMELKIKPYFMTINHTFRITLFKKYFIKDKIDHEKAFTDAERIMNEYGYEEIWNNCFKDFKKEILLNE